MADSTVRFDWNNAGFYALRSLPGVVGILEARGRSIVDSANAHFPGARAGYGMDSKQGAKRPEGRWRVTVFTLTKQAAASNARHNTLVRLLGSG